MLTAAVWILTLSERSIPQQIDSNKINPAQLASRACVIVSEKFQQTLSFPSTFIAKTELELMQMFEPAWVQLARESIYQIDPPMTSEKFFAQRIGAQVELAPIHVKQETTNGEDRLYLIPLLIIRFQEFPNSNSTQQTHQSGGSGANAYGRIDWIRARRSTTGQIRFTRTEFARIEKQQIKCLEIL